MCGKFTQMASWAEVHAFSTPLDGGDVVEGDHRQGTNDREEISTPMRDARVFRLTEAGKRELVSVRWGWPDRWTGMPVDRPKHMHAKSETVDVLRTFKDSFAMRRGILPVRMFNVGEEAGKKVIQHVLTPRDGKPLGIAVIWDTVPNRDGALIEAFVMVTTEPNALIGTVTDRMPAILPPEQWGPWLGETHASLSEVKALLAPYAGALDMTRQPKAATRPRGGSHAPGPML